MIDDKDLHYNMALYMGLMEKKYESIKQKRKQLQSMIFRAATKIQRLFRKYQLKRKTKSSIKIQRWWRRQLSITKQQRLRLQRFKRFFYGIIITKFMIKTILKKKQSHKIKNEQLPLPRLSYLTSVAYYFPDFISRKSALHAQNKYVNKYRQYLRKNFEQEWQKYQAKLKKQLWKQINKKWVKIQSKDAQKAKKKLYLNENDKQIDAEQYVQNKLNKMYEQNYGKMEITDHNLKNNQNQILFAMQVLIKRYEQKVDKC